jgi:hypothetical protein
MNDEVVYKCIQNKIIIASTYDLKGIIEVWQVIYNLLTNIEWLVYALPDSNTIPLPIMHPKPTT